ncbi:hypothetical protein [Aestuariivivens sp. NBU2969]|uniref:hypothetical protein n=1 Tax=Aestuariivivens sp. NBU2969 TaxID=2873267 RepID=UPI001CC16832|nr:hypothetical protein [Aestuariivivens sp. NBU2969]
MSKGIKLNRISIWFNHGLKRNILQKKRNSIGCQMRFEFLFTLSKLSKPAINKNEEKSIPSSTSLDEIIETQYRRIGYFNNGINFRTDKCFSNKRYKTNELIKSSSIIKKAVEKSSPIFNR